MACVDVNGDHRCGAVLLLDVIYFYRYLNILVSFNAEMDHFHSARANLWSELHRNYAVSSAELCALLPMMDHPKLQPVAAVSLNNVAVLRSRQTIITNPPLVRC